MKSTTVSSQPQKIQLPECMNESITDWHQVEKHCGACVFRSNFWNSKCHYCSDEKQGIVTYEKRCNTYVVLLNNKTGLQPVSRPGESIVELAVVPDAKKWAQIIGAKNSEKSKLNNVYSECLQRSSVVGQLARLAKGEVLVSVKYKCVIEYY